MQGDAVCGLHKTSLRRTRSVRQHAALAVHHLIDLSRVFINVNPELLYELYVQYE